MNPGEFAGTSAWKSSDDALMRLAEIGEAIMARHPGVAGEALAMAMFLYVAEKIRHDFGNYQTELEPLIANFRDTAKHLGVWDAEDIH